MIDFLYPLRFNPMFLIFWYTCILWLSVFSIIFIVLLAFGHLFFGFGYYAYLFCVVSTTAHGHREPPVFYHGIMQPFDDLRPYKLIMLVATFFVITSFLFANDLSLIAWIVIGVGVLAAPASIAVLSLEDNLLRAISPLLLIEIIKKLGKAYWISIGLFALSAFLVGLLFESEVGLFVSLFILLYSILLACRQIGFMIYHNRNHIGFEAEESPEARSAFDERLLVKQRYRFIDAAYSQRRQPGAMRYRGRLPHSPPPHCRRPRTG